MSPHGIFGPASRLLGITLEGGWEVVERIYRPVSSSGGNFSVGYRVVNKDGTQGFLKAINLSRAFDGPTFSPDLLERMMAAYIFERNLLRQCAGMTRIVRVLADGSIGVKDSNLPVLYLIFEMADGDVRHHLATSGIFDAWKLRCLHDVAVALSQLHRHGINHQDVKPSNVLVFDRKVSKLGDLGSADTHGSSTPLLVDRVAGDPDYAPPEWLYDFELTSRRDRMRARDLYLFGSLILFFFLETNTTSALLLEIPREYHPGRTGCDFKTVLPYLEDAFDSICDELATESHVPRQLVDCYRELCHPNPQMRGHARGRHQNRYSLDRYITRLDLLEKRARYALQSRDPP